MDLTQFTEKEKHDRAKKMMLWFGIASLIMGFAGVTSAYIVSSSREDWIEGLVLPQSFYISTAIIILSSLTYLIAKKASQNDKSKLVTTWLLVTLGLGIAFIVLQFFGFQEMLSDGHYFTGPTSNVKASYIYVIAGAHILHVFAGLISLLVVLYKQMTGKYSSREFLGISLGATFWHFLGILWVYLILFMSFVK